MLDPKDKNECSKYLSTGYLQHNVSKSEPAMDTNISKLIGWMDRFADEKKPMDLDKFFTYVSFDITGDIVFSKPFGKSKHIKTRLERTEKHWRINGRPRDQTDQVIQ